MQFTTRFPAVIALVNHPLALKAYYDEESLMNDSDTKSNAKSDAKSNHVNAAHNTSQHSQEVNDAANANSNAHIQADISADISGSSSSEPPQILIAEDEYLIAASIRDALMRYSKPLNVVVVQRSNMLVDNISNLNPDVLLMDITLKGAMDGIEAIQQIKQAGRDIPVIYITADSRITTLERA
jgi:CheY-like chemotaxis protein